MLNKRARQLNNKNINEAGKSVLYIMSRDQRVSDNHGLLLAQQQAIALQLPLAVVFCLTVVKGRAREQYQFMMDGLREVETTLASYNIPFMLHTGRPSQTLPGLFHHVRPAAVYVDFNPLRGPQSLHQTIAAEADFPVYEVDSHNIVPALLTSDKQEYGARTIRPKVQKMLPDFLIAQQSLQQHPVPWPGVTKSMHELQAHIDEIIGAIPQNGTQLGWLSGSQAAQSALQSFVAKRLHGYAVNRNDPTIDGQSDLSPYLHFGQLWSGTVVMAVLAEVAKNPSLQTDADAFIEEITVRKELSDNFCLYNERYDSLSGAPEWAQRTLQKHASDAREFMYSYDDFVGANTHDPAWNAAQKQLTVSGKMHGYMRMYWAKKVLEWTATPEQAVEYLIRMNDFYSIDGGDPNGYAGIAWAVAGVHDRPWGERPVYGTIRSMVYAGLKRKFDVKQFENQNCG